MSSFPEPLDSCADSCISGTWPGLTSRISQSLIVVKFAREIAQFLDVGMVALRTIRLLLDSGPNILG